MLKSEGLEDILKENIEKRRQLIQPSCLQYLVQEIEGIVFRPCLTQNHYV